MTHPGLVIARRQATQQIRIDLPLPRPPAHAKSRMLSATSIPSTQYPGRRMSAVAARCHGRGFSSWTRGIAIRRTFGD